MPEEQIEEILKNSKQENNDNTQIWCPCCKTNFEKFRQELKDLVSKADVIKICEGLMETIIERFRVAEKDQLIDKIKAEAKEKLKAEVEKL